MKVSVVDYGLGNLHSVTKALIYLGADVSLVEDAAAVDRAERLVLPGVGAFGQGMAGLVNRGLDVAIQRFAASGRPLAGICLGAQLLLSESEEFGLHEGLGTIPGRVKLLDPTGIKVPHVGWNRLHQPEPGRWEDSPLAGAPEGAWAYFVHSYQMIPEDPRDLLATTYSGEHCITAAVQRGNVVGFQYHPEKSGRAGLSMLQKFLAMRN